MVIITEILLDDIDITNEILEKFEYNSVLKINCNYNFFNFKQKDSMQLTIEYVEDNNIKYENYTLMHGKLKEIVMLPKSKTYRIFSILNNINNISIINNLLSTYKNNHTILFAFNFNNNFDFDFSMFDNIFNINVDEKTFLMKYDKKEITKILFNAENICVEAFSYSPYFINKILYEIYETKSHINYHICENNMSLINTMPMDQTKIIRISSIDVMQNLKNFMLLENTCIQLCSELFFYNELIEMMYKNFYVNYINSKKINFVDLKSEKELFKKQNEIKKNENNSFKNEIIFIASTQYPRYGGAATCAYELHKYLLNNGFNSVLSFFDNSKNIDVDPDKIGNVLQFKLHKSSLRHNNIETMKEFYKKHEIVEKIEHACGSVKPSTILAFNYLCPIIMRVLFPISKIYFLITGSKILSQTLVKIPVTDIYKCDYLHEDYLEKTAIKCSTMTIPNSGISKNIFEHFYPTCKHKFSVPWDMYELFNTQKNNNPLKSNSKNYDIVFVCSRYDREIKNVALIKDIYEDPRLDCLKKVCIGIDSNKFIKEKNNIYHFGFLSKEEVNSVLLQSKIICIPSFMESYSITNREALNNNCISICTSNVGNATTMHKFFLCSNVYDTNEWIQKILCILDNYSYYKNLAKSAYFEKSIKTCEYVKFLSKEPLSRLSMHGKQNIVVASVDLPYIGGSGTNSYNIIKHLNTIPHFSVYGIYFSSSSQNGELDPDNVGNIFRIDIDKYDDIKLKKINKLIPYPDLLFCKNYKILYALKSCFPKAITIYSPSGLRYLTSMISNNKIFYKDINTELLINIEDNIEEKLTNSGIINSMKKYDLQLDTYALKKSDYIVPNSSVTYEILKSSNINNLIRYISLTNIALTNENTYDRNFLKRKYEIGFISYSWKRACKNIDLMYTILNKFNDLKCIVIGDCVDKNKLPKNVDYLKNCNHNEVFNILKTIKVIVMCSYYDSNPNTVIESINCGCNVVMSPNVGGHEFIDPSLLVTNYNNNDSWYNCINNGLNNQKYYNGPGSHEIKTDIVELINHAIVSKKQISETSCIGVYKVPNTLDEKFDINEKPNNYSFKCEENIDTPEEALDVLYSDIYFMYTVELAVEKQFTDVHYIMCFDDKLEKCSFYNMNKYYPVYACNVYVWKLRNLYDLMYFKGAGRYFLRGTYHKTYACLLENKLEKCKAILYPATSIPFNNNSIILNPKANILSNDIKSITNIGYDIVLTNVDQNNYDKQYPNTKLVPFMKFAPDTYYLTNSKTRLIDFIFVANATQSTKNHHLFHEFILYVAERCKTSQSSYSFMFIGDIETVRKNYNCPSFGQYPPCIKFSNKNSVNSEILREIYNNSKINLIFSGRDAVPRVIFESSACGCFNIALDTLSDGKYFYDNPILGQLIGTSTIKIVKRPSKSIAYESNNEIWKNILTHAFKTYDHVKIANVYADSFSLKKCVEFILPCLTF
jgi:glycosyltransferase involved in cell wall biosynthesis|uniref:Glycosyl transferase family 1 domain-containing protein n=1 Tax=viral metagenome TaxID=1070528 RepID=A0A6C0J2Z4_9ZZZZ